MGYRRFDHTADVGLDITGDSAVDLFEQAATALMAQLIDPSRLMPRQAEKLEIDGADWPDLMVNWLREILFFWNGRRMLVAQAKLDDLAPFRLQATIACDPFDRRRHEVRTEIKAVTYHQIQVCESAGAWRARVILDV